MKNDYISSNKDAYNQLAAQYGARISEYKKSDIPLITPFINYLKTTFDQAKVLELGPGSGLALHFFHKEGFKTTAVEIAEEMIKVARRTSPTTVFINDDFLAHDFSGEKFDGIFAKAFIHLYPKVDAIKVINKIYDLLNPSGAFFLSTTLHSEPQEDYEEKADYDNSPPRFRKKWTEEELLVTFSDKWEVIKKTHNEERGKRWISFTLKKLKF